MRRNAVHALVVLNAVLALIAAPLVWARPASAQGDQIPTDGRYCCGRDVDGQRFCCVDCSCFLRGAACRTSTDCVVQP
jgi:hypothetical protein